MMPACDRPEADHSSCNGCDCYAPPVESLLQAPCPRPGHPLGDDYAPAPRATLATTQPPTIQVTPAPAGDPAAKQPEAIRVLPKVIEKDKEKDK